MKYLLLLFISFNAFSANIFFISGDNNFTGPEYSGDAAYLNQARSLYDKVLQEAPKSNQATIVFYDPKGSSRWIFRRSRRVKLDIYQNGAWQSYRSSEIDVSNIADFDWIKNIIQNIQINEKSFFYYYGEHLPMAALGGYDFSNPEGKMGMSDFLDIFDLFNRVMPIETVLLHTCNNADLLLHSMLAEKGVKTMYSSQKLIPNNAGDVTDLFKHDFLRFMSKNNNSDYPFEWKSFDLAKEFSFYLDLVMFVASMEHKDDFIQNIKNIDTENSLEQDFYLYPNELLVSLSDFMNHLSFYLSEKDVERFMELMQRQTDQLVNISSLEWYLD
ncbi:MAG: hypothetical protein CME65_06805 [Halobacteriovoraceae bacterium]|nr:hypothetical protein [Halobacteriovoraceae bacterium]|tara:strand:- start:4490 stop:5476 length:987 start_codon:yes stop_codon:yes gene_type:complete